MQLGLGFGLGVCPSSILKQKKKPTQRQITHCFLSKQPRIALAWTWRSRGALQRERGLQSSSAEGVSCSQGGRSRGLQPLSAGRRDGQAGGWTLGPARAAHARQEAAAARPPMGTPWQHSLPLRRL